MLGRAGARDHSSKRLLARQNEVVLSHVRSSLWAVDERRKPTRLLLIPGALDDGKSLVKRFMHLLRNQHPVTFALNTERKRHDRSLSVACLGFAPKRILTDCSLCVGASCLSVL